MYNVSIENDIASMIAGKSITHLTPDQATYLNTAIQHLPKKRLDAIYNRANGEVPNDAFVDVYEDILQRALKDARELIDVDILTISSQPISKVLEMANGDATKSYDDILRAICEDRILKLRDPYVCRDTTFHAFRDETGAQCSLALYDCDKLLSEEAFTGELASFREALVNQFKFRSWDAQPASYLEAINKIVRIAKADAKDDKHYSEVVEKTIVVFQKALSEALIADPLVARKHILFKQLPIHASAEEIGWAMNTTWIADKESIKSLLPIVEFDCCRGLLCLGFRTMGDLTDPVAKKKLEKHPELRKKVEQSIRTALG